jgi:hypothetical protein
VAPGLSISSEEEWEEKQSKKWNEETTIKGNDGRRNKQGGQ